MMEFVKSVTWMFDITKAKNKFPMPLEKSV